MKRLRFYALYTLFLLLVAELACRGFWKFTGVSFWAAPSRIQHYWYPELKQVDDKEVRRDDETFDVLFLGGSVMEFQDLDERIAKALEADLKRPVRYYNLAFPAHTTRDSLFKYRHLEDQRFDLVFVYHGINDTRANNCPPELYRDDYTHYRWYKLVQSYEEAGWRPVVLPYTADFVRIKVAAKLGWIRFVPKEQPGPELVRYAGDIRSEKAFRANLAQLADLAAARGDPLVLGTFAIHVAEGYSDEKFTRDELDYAKGGYPTSLWGKSEHVAAGVKVHNGVLRQLAERKDVHVVDLDTAMPRGKAYYTDVCHLTDEGRQRFAELLVTGIRRQGVLP